MGVLPICCTKSKPRASVASEVWRPTMISTNGILSTGLKKCSPMKFAGRPLAWARPVMGSVEVLEANTALAPMTASARAVTSALTARSSNTASITRSQPAKREKSVLGVMSASSASRFSGVLRPFFSAASSRSCEYALPRSAPSWVVSISTTSRPALAAV